METRLSFRLRELRKSSSLTPLQVIKKLKEQKTGQAKSTAAVHLPAFHTFPLQL